MSQSKNRSIPKPPPLYQRIRAILDSARANVARTVNTTQVIANWLIGRTIVEEEQHGKKRAGYGEELLASLAERFRADGIVGYSLPNLRFMRQFFLVFPELLDPDANHYALRSESDLEATNDSSPRANKLTHPLQTPAETHYELHLPTEAELTAELNREVRALGYVGGRGSNP